MNDEREQIEFDILFVGGGPANLAGAIRLMQLANERGLSLEVALIEKGAEIGSHLLSGAVMNPKAIKELMPDYLEKGCPIEANIRGDGFYFLMPDKKIASPIIPKYFQNKNYHTISLSKLVSWMAELAEEMGVNIFPGFAGTEVLYDENNKVIGVRTGDKGLDKNGNPKGNFEPGMDIIAKTTIFGEGSRGSLIKQIHDRLNIFPKDMPQVFEIGIKEVLELPEDNYFKTSKINNIHTLGYPLGMDAAGGGFVYEMSNNRLALGILIGLSYEDPMLDIYEEFMRFKRHPFISRIIKDGKVIEQGARTVCMGGYYSMPNLAVDGALFVGGSASMQNIPALKGIHTSMKSGMLAAEAVIEAIQKDDFTTSILKKYPQLVSESWINDEMLEGRNFSQAIAKKALLKMVHLGALYFTKGKGIIDPLKLKDDSKVLKPKSQQSIVYKKQEYDGELFIDKLTGVYLSKTQHREDQPGHIKIKDINICIEKCFSLYDAPCVRFCPGSVYEVETDEGGNKKLIVNHSNCLHCKTCDIKDPFQNILWTCPEGGDGPGYSIV